MQANKEFNSCDAQRERILSYIHSQPDLELYKEYSDPGFTGANIKRPGLNKLLQDVKSGKIQRVLTYKIDRLTRSSKDFYSLIEYLDKYSACFISVTEQFDTSSPSGRLLRNIMLTFAQFEREMLGERVRDKLEQKSIKGMWNGGHCPVGYRAVDKKLVIDPKHAEIIKKLFNYFISSGSMRATARFAKASNLCVPATGNLLKISTISHMIRNRIYCGQSKNKGKFYQGIHEPIISLEVFERAQTLLKQAMPKSKIPRHYILRGRIRCSDCGSLMTPCHTKKPTKKYYYYKCHRVIREGKDVCGLKQISADRVETLVFDHMARLSKDDQQLENIAFRMAFEFEGSLSQNSNSTPPKSFELQKRITEEIKNKLKNTLEDFVFSDIENNPANKALIAQKHIQSILLKKETLEVSLSLKEQDSYNEWNELIRESHGGRQSFAGQANNPLIPFRTSHLNDIRESSKGKIGSSNLQPSNVLRVIPHQLFDVPRRKRV